MNIPKKLWQTWIGPNPAPLKWMNTWPEKHPDWEYKIVDNEYVSNRKFYNQHLIDEFMNRPKDAGYAGAADLIRYEILYEFGGFMPGADAVCLENTDELWVDDPEICYTVYENEILRPKYVSPIYACNPGNKFLEIIIEKLHALDVNKFGRYVSVFRTTGNAFLADMIQQHNPHIKIFPSHYFIPCHFLRPEQRYSGPDKIYADQMWGTTKKIYDHGV
jgi:mannosyltransferase OCH1-like enzyme